MRSLILVVFFLVAGTFANSQPLTGKAIDSLVERTRKAFNVPGIAVGIIKDGKVIHAKGYGVRSLNSGQPVDEHTLFGIASNTKAFTAAALGMLVDEGKLNWDDKVRDYIPEFKLYNPYVSEEFTVRDLLTHRSGLGLGAGDLMFFPDSSDFTLKDVIYNLRFLKPVSPFRTRYDYDNNLYIVAGEVLARASGTGWDDFVEQRIFKPLGMTATAAAYDRLHQAGNVIDAHAPVNGKVQVIARSTLRVGHAAGSIYSNITDLSQWVALHLAGGVHNGRRLISKEVLDEMATPQTIIPVRSPGPYNTHFSAYGLGFFLVDVKGYKQLSHTGGLEGMVTQITLLPELNLGIIVLTNQQEGSAFTAITNQLKDGYLNIAGTDRVTEYYNRRQQSLAMAAKITDSLWKEVDKAQQSNKGKRDYSAYVGTYKDPWLGEAVVSVKNGTLWFDAKRSPKLTGQMLPYKANSFIIKWRDRSMDADAFANFTLDIDGKGSRITLKAISPLTDFSYDFHDLDFQRVP